MAPYDESSRTPLLRLSRPWRTGLRDHRRWRSCLSLVGPTRASAVTHTVDTTGRAAPDDGAHPACTRFVGASPRCGLGSIGLSTAKFATRSRCAVWDRGSSGDDIPHSRPAMVPAGVLAIATRDVDAAAGAGASRDRLQPRQGASGESAPRSRGGTHRRRDTTVPERRGVARPGAARRPRRDEGFGVGLSCSRPRRRAC
jgi:hypothetical protein